MSNVHINIHYAHDFYIIFIILFVYIIYDIYQVKLPAEYALYGHHVFMYCNMYYRYLSSGNYLSNCRYFISILVVVLDR